MLYHELTINNTDYKLRLTTRNIVALEKQLGCNPLSIFGANGDRIPTITEMVNILHQSLQAYHHSISLNDAYELFDKYLEDGNNSVNFIPVIIEIYKASGIIEQEGTGEKN